MKYKEWIKNIIDNGKLCEEYKSKVGGAISKKQLMDVVLDANGAKYIPEMQSQGYTLPYETILKEFGNYINGRYVSQQNGYTSEMYCCYCDESFIEVRTTQTILLGCSTVLYIKENTIVQILADKNCDLIIHCPRTSKVRIDCWDGAKIKVLDNIDGVSIRKND